MKRINNLLIWSFVLWINILSYGQSPGGVNGAQAWFKTNRLTNGYFNWQDYSGDGVKLNKWNSENEYLSSGRYFNFNPALYLDGGSQQYLAMPEPILIMNIFYLGLLAEQTKVL
jgi:hypothetical protein